MKERLIFLFAAAFAFSLPAMAQQPDAPVVVQPGPPGAPSRTLPADTRAVLPTRSPKDVEFMQGMIMHHAQAVEMTAMIEAQSENKALRRLGARISASQSDEMAFMRRWLAARGESETMAMPGADMSGMDMASHAAMMMMPGMLTPAQMRVLKAARGADFDRLFLKGMIQHHKGALEMVRDLFATTGAGQDGEIFNFATDVDSGQRAEIKIMETMLGEKK